MDIVRLRDVELVDRGLLSVAFPISSATGTADTAVVYLEFEPGGELAAHTDSAEELLLVLEGTAEGIVGDETARLEAGDVRGELAEEAVGQPGGLLDQVRVLVVPAHPRGAGAAGRRPRA